MIPAQGINFKKDHHNYFKNIEDALLSVSAVFPRMYASYGAIYINLGDLHRVHLFHWHLTGNDYDHREEFKSLYVYFRDMGERHNTIEGFVKEAQLFVDMKNMENIL